MLFNDLDKLLSVQQIYQSKLNQFFVKMLRATHHVKSLISWKTGGRAWFCRFSGNSFSIKLWIIDLGKEYKIPFYAH